MVDTENNGTTPLGASSRNQWTVSRESVDMVRQSSQAHPVTVIDGGRKVRFDLARTALVIVDMQNDFCHADGWLAHIGVDISAARKPIEPLRALLPTLRTAGVPVIWVNWGNRADRANLSPGVLHVYNPYGNGNGIGDPLPRHDARVLLAGSWSTAIVDELGPAADDIHVDKYSMSGFHDTVLDSVLRNLNVTTLLFAGVNLDQCVLCTLQDANFRGYDCLLLDDCSATTSPDFCAQASLYNVRQCFGFVCASTDISDQLK
ncbi:cysteine hydrolase family protein [Rhizobium sp. S152]|uniref:cysteine hydrolase family protein n=1 Tax=Rhizobium sp. S152 TaxID=3055038 RepID=UPI0025A961EE|nr:cysteine hydrolase family protein [Rhizobium sp. S152]MDM9627869.1 cysteine hydrolase family protein [Rhizobium sp. S152]